MAHRWRFPSRDGGFNLTELVVVMAVLAITSVLVLPRLESIYRKHQLNIAATEFQVMVLQARISAVKEKVSYRLVVHDESTTVPNRYELQKLEGGSWVGVEDGIRDLPDTVAILGSDPTDSLDNVTVSGRGLCSAGKLFLRSDDGSLQIVSLDLSCFVTV